MAKGTTMRVLVVGIVREVTPDEAQALREELLNALHPSVEHVIVIGQCTALTFVDAHVH